MRKGGYTVGIKQLAADSSASWTFHNGKEDLFHVVIEYSRDSKDTSGEVAIQVTCAGEKLEAVLGPSGVESEEMQLRKVRIGSITIPAGRNKTLAFRLLTPDTIDGLQIVSVTLKPSHLSTETTH